MQQVFKCLDCKATFPRAEPSCKAAVQRLNAFGLCAACERRALRQDYEAKR